MKKLCMLLPAHWAGFMGGAQYQARCIIDALLPGGRYDITYLSRRIDPAYRPQDYRIVPVRRSVARPPHGFYVDTCAVWAHLRRLRPDVIYQRVACAYTGIGAAWARHAGCRMVWHVAHDDEVTPQGMWRGRHPGHRIEQRYVEYGIRHANAIVVQTAQQAELLQRHFGRSASAIIPNLQPEPQEPLDKPLPVRVVWVANWKTWKRPEAFVALARELQNLPGVRCIMIGARQTDNPPWQRRLLEEIAVLPNLEYRGELPQEDVNRVLAGAHVFVNTSVNEGFANTFIQAWMRRVPVVSLGVNPDGVFDRAEIGYCAGTPAHLHELVAQLCTDHALRERLGTAAQHYARAQHGAGNIEALVRVLEG